MKNKINNKNIHLIYNNLDEICKLIGKYNNIIFISNNENDNKMIDFIKNYNEININFLFNNNIKKNI